MRRGQRPGAMGVGWTEAMRRDPASTSGMCIAPPSPGPRAGPAAGRSRDAQPRRATCGPTPRPWSPTCPHS